jgi:ATP-dependent helicase/nuclease subunit A
MTVHGAKGLEAPIVMIPDAYQMKQNNSTLRPIAVPGLDDHLPLFPAASRYVDTKADVVIQAADAVKQAENEESHRLLYVAMTRAMDGLYISAFDKPQSRFEKNSWYLRIAAAMDDLGAEQNDHGWFYGSYADAPKQKPEQKPEKASDHMPKHKPDIPDWVNHAPKAEPKPPRPVAPSRLSVPPTMGSITGTVRKDAIRRGQIIHRLLETLPKLTPDLRAAAADRIINAHAKAGDSEATKTEWVQEAQAIMDMPELAALFTNQAYAEIPVSGLVGHYAVSGVIDRLVETDDTVIFVDFKTGHSPDDLCDIAPSYVTQMGLYARLLGEIFPDKRINAGLIYTEAPRLFWLTDDMLAEAVRTFFHNP